MKGPYLLHVLIVVALCVGQIASNAHIISHLQHPVHQHDNPNQNKLSEYNPGQNSHEHHQHLDFSDRYSQQSQNKESDTNTLDCSIYHLYVGLNAITAKGSIEIATALPDIAHSRYFNLAAAQYSADWQPIRGPPGFS